MKIKRKKYYQITIIDMKLNFKYKFIYLLYIKNNLKII